MGFPQVRYSQFLPSSLLELLVEKYDLPKDSTCVLFKNGLNDIYKITTCKDTYFLRISMFDVYSTDEIKEEINFILHLRSLGLDVVEPIALRDKSYVFEIEAPEGVRQAVMFGGIAQAPSGDANVRMENLGVLVAKMHLATKSFGTCSSRPPVDEKMLVHNPVFTLTPFLKHRPDDLDFLNKTAERLWQKAELLLSHREGVKGFCHGDVQPNNFFFQGETPVLFDFDCMGFGYFAYDLGVLLTNLTFMDAEIYKAPIWKSVIKGYSSQRKLDKDEEKAVFAFAALHMLRVLTYHAKLIEQNQGTFFYMTDTHLDTFFGAYKRLAELACKKLGLKI